MFATDFGRELPEKVSNQLLQLMKDALEIKKDTDEFIGSHPVTFSKESIQSLLNEDYFVCEKSDGIRLMMFIYEGTVYFYDRKNRFYVTDLIFKAQFQFLFDGEMYLEDKTFIFSVFDTLLFDSKPRLHAPLNKRLGYCFEFEKIVQKGFIMRKNHSELKMFHIIGKIMFKSYSFLDILKGIPLLKHENDGLIFTPVNEPYLISSRSKIYKWKPAHLNTVDFLIKKTANKHIFGLYTAVSSDQMKLYISSSNSNVLFDYYFTEDTSEDLDGKIGEFSYKEDEETYELDDLATKQGGWVLHRIREDKNSGNNIKIVLDIVNSFKQHVDDIYLIQYQEEIKTNYKKRESQSNKL
ncbi:Dcp1p-Dcp2p decapping enzyme complex alpha subunit [Glugoides intestinalis]